MARRRPSAAPPVAAVDEVEVRLQAAGMTLAWVPKPHDWPLDPFWLAWDDRDRALYRSPDREVKAAHLEAAIVRLGAEARYDREQVRALRQLELNAGRPRHGSA